MMVAFGHRAIASRHGAERGHGKGGYDPISDE
jgi:hypothetical protein